MIAHHGEKVEYVSKQDRSKCTPGHMYHDHVPIDWGTFLHASDVIGGFPAGVFALLLIESVQP
jgi:hypothetical protein